MNKYWLGTDSNNGNQPRFFDQNPTGKVNGIENVTELSVEDNAISGIEVTCLHEQTQGSSSQATQA